MIMVIIFLLSSFGLTNILVRESVFEKPKLWIDKTFKNSLLNKMLKCETCTGFWCGMLLSFILPTICEDMILGTIIAGFVSSAFIKITLLTIYKF